MSSSKHKELAARMRREAKRADSEDFVGQLRADLFRAAADLLDPPDDESTVEVRIHARVDVVDGVVEWQAAGWSQDGKPSDEARLVLEGESPSPRYSVITARLPKPEPDAKVEGTVE